MFCSYYQNNSTSSPGFYGQRLNNLQSGCTFNVILTSSVQYDTTLSKFGQQQLVMVNYAYGFNQSEMGKYFEWIIIQFICQTFRFATVVVEGLCSNWNSLKTRPNLTSNFLDQNNLKSKYCGRAKTIRKRQVRRRFFHNSGKKISQFKKNTVSCGRLLSLPQSVFTWCHRGRIGVPKTMKLRPR